MSAKVQAFVDGASEGGVQLNFNSAFRTVAQQGNLQNDPTAITPATLSLHSAGLAVDVNYSSLPSDAMRTVVRNAASAAGLSWGGNFGTPDPPHFYFNPGGDRAQLVNDAQYNYNNF